MFRISVLFLILYLFFSREQSKSRQVERVLAKQELQKEMSWFNFSNLVWQTKELFIKIQHHGPSLEEQMGQLSEEVQNNFIKRFQRVAIVEQKKFGIPASITIANSLLLSNAGKNRLALEGNNFFSLLVTDDWKGDTLIIEDKIYRKYENAWLSFRDHSFFLTTGQNQVFTKIPAGDYKSWAEVIGPSLYPEEPNISSQIESVILNFGLDKLDNTQ